MSPYNIDSPILEQKYTTEYKIDQETPSTPCNNKSKKQSRRTTNFCVEEDKLLIDAWLNTSLDQIKASNQKNDRFWKRVTHYFNDHKSWPDERTEKSLINRWSKISFGVSRFSRHYAAVEHLRKNGCTETDKIQESKMIYKDKEGHQFRLDHCWMDLKFQQKWMDENRKTESSRNFKAPSSKDHIPIRPKDGNENAPELAPLKRPFGRNVVKEANKKAKSNVQGDANEKEPSTNRIELEEVKVRRLESDHVNAKQLKMLIDIEEKQVALREKEIELQARSEETKIMCMDTSSMNPLQAEYIISLQKEILAKRNGKKGNQQFSLSMLLEK